MKIALGHLFYFSLSSERVWGRLLTATDDMQKEHERAGDVRVCARREERR